MKDICLLQLSCRLSAQLNRLALFQKIAVIVELIIYRAHQPCFPNCTFVRRSIVAGDK